MKGRMEPRKFGGGDDARVEHARIERRVEAERQGVRGRVRSTDREDVGGRNLNFKLKSTIGPIKGVDVGPNHMRTVASKMWVPKAFKLLKLVSPRGGSGLDEGTSRWAESREEVSENEKAVSVWSPISGPKFFGPELMLFTNEDCVDCTDEEISDQQGDPSGQLTEFLQMTRSDSEVDPTPLAIVEPTFCNGMSQIGEEEWRQLSERSNSCGKIWARRRVMGLSKFLGVSVKGCEDEASQLFEAINNRWGVHLKKKNGSALTQVRKEGRVVRELRNLECTIDYDGATARSAEKKAAKGKGVVIVNNCL